jgi:poly(A) polymerase
MLQRAILRPVLPEIEPERLCDLEALIAAERQAQIPPDPLRRLASLLPRDPEIADAVAVRLKLSNKARKRLVCAAEAKTDIPAQSLAYRVGTDCAVDRLLLSNNPEAAQAISEWKAPRLPISGGGLIARGLPEGPIVAKTLKAIEERWLEAGFPTGEKFERIVAQALAQG